MKIYELAKELNISSLALVEELKEYGFKVKNHMEEITPRDISVFKNKRASGLTVKKEKALIDEANHQKEMEKARVKSEAAAAKQAKEVIENFPQEAVKFIFQLKRILDMGNSLSEHSNEIYEMWAKFERKNKAALFRKKK